MTLAAALLGPSATLAAPSEEDALIELHLEPVAGLQIAIWLEDSAGNFLTEVFVTQATGKLGIGNRPGLPLFLSSWRAPYGPREGVLPVWAHRRGGSYPKIMYADASAADHTSQGYHETSSSPESYFCRPLTPSEDEAIVDVMSCPSPASFNTDKGRFDPERSSPYPPRNDLIGDHEHDSADVALYAGLNELDAITSATPEPGPLVLTHRLDHDELAALEGPLVAWIEVSLERDENPEWSFGRDSDHTLDSSVALQGFGREFLGQPSMVYRVEFDPAAEGYSASESYAGYGDLYGKTGALFPPDASISTSGGSGADRLALHERFGQSARFGVFSHGWGSAESGASTGCALAGASLPPVQELRLESVAYDTVRAHFRMPELPPGVEAARVFADWITPEPENFDLGAAKSVAGIPAVCRADSPADPCIEAAAGEAISVDIDQLFGNYTYAIAISYADPCTARSELAVAEITTSVQPFTTLDAACFVATAAWGAGWTEELRALRWFRDTWLLPHTIGSDLVRSYYAYGPMLAELIRERPPLRAATRHLLGPFAALARGLASGG